MKKIRYTEEQIAFALKQASAWRHYAERCAFLKPLFTIGRKKSVVWG